MPIALTEVFIPLWPPKTHMAVGTVWLAWRPACMPVNQQKWPCGLVLTLSRKADDLIWRGWVSKWKPKLFACYGSHHSALLLIIGSVEKHLSSLHPVVLLQVSCNTKKSYAQIASNNLFPLTGLRWVSRADVADKCLTSLKLSWHFLLHTGTAMKLNISTAVKNTSMWERWTEMPIFFFFYFFLTSIF